MSKKRKVDRKSESTTRRIFLKTTRAVWLLISMLCVLGFYSPKITLATQSQETLNVVLSHDADSYDAHAWISTDGRMIGAHIFEALLDKDGSPLLATSWENPDPYTWIFHLKKDVKFTNGETFDASVVKFNLERIKDPKTKARYASLLKPVESVEVVDKYKVKIKTKIPYSVLLYVLPEMYMMSPKAIREAGKDVNKKPIGTGPYVLEEWVPMEKTILKANPDYYGSKPKVKRIVWKPIAEPSTRIVELMSGNADIINKVPPELAGGLNKDDKHVVRQRSYWLMTIKLNCSVPPFDKIKVRQAFNYATNKEDLIKYVLRGAGYPAACPLGPDRIGFNPKIKPYPHDPEKAKKLLAEAGYPDGVDIEILSPSGRYLKDKEICEAISFQVKEAGFNMKVRPVEWGIFVKTFKQYNGFFIGMYYTDPHKVFESGDSRAKGFSWMGYHSDYFNSLFDQTMKTFDETKRVNLYQQLSQIYYDESPYLWLYFAQDIYGVSNRLKNFKARADGYIFLKKSSIE